MIATAALLNVMVSATHPLRFGNFVLRHNMIVGGCEGVLGVDVLHNRKRVLNLGGGYLDLSGHIIPLDHTSFVSTPICRDPT